MGLFDRKKKDDATDSLDVTTSPSGGAHAAPKAKKKNEKLASVFKETVIDSALNEMRENPLFTMPFDFDGSVQDAHVLWMLDTNDIGGLSKKQARDEDRGAIIQCVNSGRIKAFMNEGMLEDDAMAFITDADTVSAMREFTLLVNAPYHLMFVADDGYGLMCYDEEFSVSLADAEAILAEEMTIQDFVNKCMADAGLVEGPANDVYDEPQEDFYVASDDVAGPIEGTDVDVNFDDIDEAIEDDMYSDIDAAIYDPADAAAMEAAYAADDVAMDDQAAVAADIHAQAQQSMFDRTEAAPEWVDNAVYGAAAQEDEVISTDDASRNIASSYYRDDLGFEISLDVFDTQFGDGPELTYFEEDRGEGFMNEYLSQMSRDANLEMDRQHSEHLYLIRERYVRMMNALADQIAKKYDIDSTANMYGAAKERIKLEFQEKVSDIDRYAQAERDSINAEYDKRVREAGEAAALQAQDVYRKRTEESHKRELMDVENDVLDRFNIEFQNQLNEIKIDRREAARKDFDQGLSQIMSRLSASYRDMLVKEDETYQNLRADINAWIDRNRKDDIAYAEALREDQRQAEKSEQIRTDYMARMQQQENDFAARRKALEEEIADLKTRHANLLEDMGVQHDNEMASLREKNADLQQRFDELLDRYAALDSSKNAEYENRLAQARDEVAAERKRYEALQGQNKNVSYVWIALAIVAVIAALCIGMVLGLHQTIDYSINNAVNSTSATIYDFDWLLE